MTLQVRQHAAYQGNEWWKWAVWLDGPAEELKGIKEIEYTLHPTFPDPVRRVRTRSNGFRLESEGWGEFEIFIRVIRGDGKIVKRRHQLKLEYPSLKGATTGGRRASAEAHKTATSKKRAKGRHANLKRRSAGVGTVEDQHKSAPANIFISSSAADAKLARMLKDELLKRGRRVTSVEDVDPGIPIEHALKRAIEGADAAVFLVSGRPNLWADFEMGYAVSRNRPVIPVLVGTSTPIPGPFSTAKVLRVARGQEIASVANEILAAAQPMKLKS